MGNYKYTLIPIKLKYLISQSMIVFLKLDQPTNQPMEQNLCGAHTCFGTQGKIFLTHKRK